MYRLIFARKIELTGFSLAFLALLNFSPAAAGAPRRIGHCESYLTAPDEIKIATRSVLSRGTSKRNRLFARDSIALYFRTAPAKQKRLANYLKYLATDSLEPNGKPTRDFALRLFIDYLLRPENQTLAIEYLPEVLAIYRFDLDLSQIEDQALANQIPKLVETLAKSYPRETKDYVDLIKFIARTR